MVKSQEGLQVIPLHNKQWEEVLQFINEHFVHRETLNQRLKALAKDLHEFHEIAIRNWLSSGCSMGVIDETSKKLVGVCMCAILTKEESTTFHVGENINEKVTILRSILGSLEKQIDVFAEKSIEKVLEIALVCVNENYSGRGISYKLLEECEVLGVKGGCQLAFTQATGLGSQHIFTKNNYKTMKEVNYGSLKTPEMGILDLSSKEGASSILILLKDIRSN